MSIDPRLQELILLERIGALQEHEQLELRQLLEQHPEARAIYEQLRTEHGWHHSYEAMQAWQREPKSFTALLQQHQVETIKRERRPKWWSYVAAAVVVLPLLLGGIYTVLRAPTESISTDAKEIVARNFEATVSLGDDNASTMALAVPIEKSFKVPYTPKRAGEEVRNYHIATTPGNEFRVTLEDGTVIHLNHGSELHFPNRFSSTQRKVYLRGEAYVQVAKDSRPFVIITEGMTIRQYGTTFAVKAYEAEKTEVVLIEGSIGVHALEQGIEMGKETRLCPGQLARIVSKEIKLEEVDIVPYESWAKGHYRFVDTSLEQLMEVLTKWYDITVEFRDDSLRQRRFTGDVDRFGSIAPILDALHRVLEVPITIEDTHVYIGE